MVSLQAILDKPAPQTIINPEIARFFRYEKGKIIPVWGEIRGVDPLQHAQDPTLYNQVMIRLMMQGVLSPDCRDHFAVTLFGSILNPKIHMGEVMQELFFTSKERAQEYRYACYRQIAGVEIVTYRSNIAFSLV